MQKYLTFLLVGALLLFSAGESVLSAQCIRQDGNPVFRESDAGFYNVYDENAPKVITEVPKGYKVAGLSHMGRHGSRYCSESEVSFTQLAEMLQAAHDEDVLTERGEMIYRTYKACYPKLAGREGELTQLGRKQHKGIAKRMYLQNRSLFTPKSTLTAWSTTYPRCIESMGAFCEQLVRMNPAVEVEVEVATPYLGQVSATQEYYHWYKNPSIRAQIRAKKDSVDRLSMDTLALARAFFKDPSYRLANVKQLAKSVWAVYVSLPSSDIWKTPESDAFRYAVDGKACGVGPEMPPFYSDETWSQMIDAFESSYIVSICFPGIHYHGLINIFMTKALMELADKDLASGKPFVRLRFGHDTDLTAQLMNIGVRGWRSWMFSDTLSKTEACKRTQDEWNMSRIPMASNLQYVFYRHKSTSRVLFKLLLNESELELPIPAVTGRIYDWEAFKAYMAPRIQEGIAKAQSTLPYPYPIPRQ